MIPKDLRPFLFVYCHECSMCYEMHYDRHSQMFYCPECYEDAKYDDVDPEEFKFDTRMFVYEMKQERNSAKRNRLISLYMDMDKIDDVPTEHESVQWIQDTHYSNMKRNMF